MRALSQLRRPGALDVLRVDAKAVVVAGGRERLVDVAFDGRRIWSFWVQRDGEQRDDGIHLHWPKPLRPFLDGVTEVTLTDPGTDTVLFSRTVQFGERPDRIEVANPAGRPLAIDKCKTDNPPLAGRGTGRVACWRAGEAEVA